MKNLTGRYLLALVDYPNGGSVRKGEYGLINDQYGFNIDFESQKNYYYTNFYKESDRIKLMSIGFNPNNVNILEKVEIY